MFTVIMNTVNPNIGINSHYSKKTKKKLFTDRNNGEKLSKPLTTYSCAFFPSSWLVNWTYCSNTHGTGDVTNMLLVAFLQKNVAKGVWKVLESINICAKITTLHTGKSCDHIHDHTHDHTPHAPLPKQRKVMFLLGCEYWTICTQRIGCHCNCVNEFFLLIWTCKIQTCFLLDA